MRVHSYILSVTLILISVSYSTAEKLRRHKRQDDEECDPNAKYRELDSFCNNLQSPGLGAAYDILSRTLPPAYEDGVSLPRQKSVDGSPLPHPRVISTTVHMERNLVDGKHSTMLMQWGQFINHDMTATPNTTDSEGDITDCCLLNTDVTNDPNSDCFPIHIGEDPYFDKGRCMNFVRSQTQTGTGKTRETPRVTYNAASAFIDASHIYGPYVELEAFLRDTTGGRLKVENINGKAFPPADEPKNCFEGNKPESYCFLTGDMRANAFVGLSAMHIVFLREHNRLAGELAKLHPTWGNNRLFQEAKKILIAELQIITYRDWLPLIIGPLYMDIYDLPDEYEYIPAMDPRISNAFATSAMRFGHSMIPDSLQIGGQTRFIADLISTTKPVIENLEDVLNSIIGGINHKADAWFVNDMTRFMFQTKPDVKDGYDIVSLNIQRGRDHGIPNYNKWREYCEDVVLTDFSDEYLYTKAANDMKKVYKSVNDIDLFTGAMSEWPVPNGVVGDTNACLLADQFMRIKYGDRFFWQTPDTRIGFTQAQKTELSKVTLARILCDNTDLARLQSNVFLKPGSGNPQVACSQIPAIDLSKW